MPKHKKQLENSKWSGPVPPSTRKKRQPQPNRQAALPTRQDNAAAPEQCLGQQSSLQQQQQQHRQPAQPPQQLQAPQQPHQPPRQADSTSGKVSSRDDEVRRLFRSWAWKREHRPDKDRFQRPYTHTLFIAGDSSQHQQETVTIKQQKFTREGFASTVWDSCIVVSKYLEKLGPNALRGKRCLDLSAGCGLAGLVMAKLGAHVTLTDLTPNLPLLQHNCSTNGVYDACVAEHRWGSDVSALGPPFDVIVACDVMYVDELVPALLQSLRALSGPGSLILVAHGRNRPAEPSFKARAASDFCVELVPVEELDEVYNCADVDVLRLKWRKQ